MKHKVWYTYLIAFIVSIGGLLLGLSANISGASEFYRLYFDLKVGSFLEGLGVSIAMLATFIGTFVAGTLSDKIGRKKILLLAAFLFSFCTLGSAMANSYLFLLASRFIGGLGIGFSLVVVPLFIAEFAPPEKRGFLVSFNQLNIGIGFLLAYLINTFILKMVTDPALIWRWMLGAGFIIPGIYFFLLFMVPESPRWLVENGKSEKAKKVLAKFNRETASEELQKIESSLKPTKGKAKKPSYREQWVQVFSKPMRLILLVAFSIAFFQMATGFNSVMFFVPRIFRLAGFGGSGSFFMSNIVGISMVVMTIVSMLFIDKLGRKPLLLIGVAVMAASVLVSSAAFYSSTYKVSKEGIESIVAPIKNQEEAQLIEGILRGYENIEYTSEVKFFKQFESDINEKIISNNQEGAITIQKQTALTYSKYKGALLDASISINSVLVMVAILGFVMGFAISLGPITWALLSEIFPGKIRGLGMSIASTLNGVTSFVVTTIFPIELEYLGSGTTFLIYGGLLFVFILMVVKWFPETKGKTLEEIEAELVKN